MEQPFVTIFECDSLVTTFYHNECNSKESYATFNDVDYLNFLVGGCKRVWRLSIKEQFDTSQKISSFN